MHSDTHRLLIVTRERLLGDLLAETLSTRRYQCVVHTQPTTVSDRFVSERPTLTIVDLASLDSEGLEVIADIRRLDPNAAVIALIGPKTSSLEPSAYNLGVTDVLRRQDDITQMLRLLDDAAADDAARASMSTGPIPIVDEPSTVLVVDDDPNVRRLLERVLSRDGYPVLTASDGVEALEVLQRERVRVMFLDLRMPRLGGLAVLRRLGDMAAPPRTIVISGLADQDLKDEAIGMGAFDYLQKPVSVDRVLVTASAAMVLESARRRSFWQRWRRRLS